MCDGVCVCVFMYIYQMILNIHMCLPVVKEMYASTLGSGMWYRKDLPSIIGTQQLEFIYP